MRRLASLVGVALALACRPESEAPLVAPADPPAAVSAAPPDARERVLAWLECEECSAGELDRMVALGEPVVPLLAATLRRGLSPATRAELTLRLEERWEARAAQSPPERAPAKQDYVARAVAARDALHRVRAATGLGRIGSAAAVLALREALAEEQRPSVERAIRDALAKR